MPRIGQPATTPALWCACLIALVLSASAATANTNIMFILDGSNSMWGRIDGVPKIATAKNVLTGLLRDLEADTQVGFMAYGHRSEGACDDIEMLSGIGATPPEALVAKLQGIMPKGKTPIADALKMTRLAFATPDANNNVVLISDGAETCNGNPCAEAKALAEAGINTRVHVVGFDIDAKRRAQLECIAEAGKGRYFSANTTEEFKVALADVKQAAQLVRVAEAEPAPKPKSAWTEAFKDSFAGDGLAEHWDVRNANPDGFVVEDGNLLVISKQVGGLGNKDIPNLFKLGYEMPKGDWRMTVKLKAELQTGRESFMFGLMKDENNYIAAQFYGQNDICCYNSGLFITMEKVSKGQRTHFSNLVWPKGSNNYAEYVKNVPMPISLRLIKEGRGYRAAIHFAGDQDDQGMPRWQETDIVTTLRAPKDIVFNSSQWKKVNGESLFFIDEITIETKQGEMTMGSKQ